MEHQAEVTIIGGGVVGLAVANELAKTVKGVYILEKNDAFGLEQSSRNSEVIHGGIYYDKDSLKTILCLEGNALLYELCGKTGIACNKCGKLIVAANKEEATELDKLYQKGIDNGALLKMLSSRELQRLEPNIKGVSAFLSPETGIMDSHALMRYFLGEARANGAEIAYKTEVTGITKISGGYELTVNDPTGTCSFTTGILINCAGLYSDRVSEMAGIGTDEADYRLHYCKGEYYSVSGGKNKLVNSLIYPVPMDISVGAHVCLDTDWRLRIGPHFHYVENIDYTVNNERKPELLNLTMMEILSFIEPDDLDIESSGIMAMLQGKDQGFRDFVIKHEDERGLPGFINLVGIDSPGLTSSPAIGRYVSRMVKGIL